MPLYIYRREGDGKERATAHPAYRLLRRQVNSEMTANVWKRLIITHALVFGKSFTWIVRDNGGRPVELLPIYPENVRPHRDPATKRLYYSVKVRTLSKEPPMLVLPENLFILLGVTLDGLDALSLIEYARNSIGRGLAAEKHSNRFFRNNATPGGLLVHPHRLDEIAINNLRETFANMHSGLENAYRFAILEEGMEYKQMGISPEDSQLIESLQFGVKDAARLLGIPPHRLGDETRTSFASLEQENRSYQETTLGFWFDAMQEEAYAKLLTDRQQERDTHTVEFLRNQILLADAKTRHEVYSIGLQNGFYSRDEVRSWENLNPLPNGEGQDYFVPLNMGMASDETTDEVTEESEESESEAAPRSDELITSQRALIEDACTRASERLRHYFTRASRNGSNFCKLVDDLDERHKTVVTRMFVAPVASVVANGLPCPGPEELASRFLDMWRRSMDTVSRTADAETLQPRAEAVIASLVENGADTFVKTVG